MDLKEQLLTELKELRQGSGLTARRLDALPTLRERVGGRTKEDAAERLMKLVAMIGDAKQLQAVANALSLIGGKENKLGARRKSLARVLKSSEKTIERLENVGLADLAQIILECSTEGDYEVPASQRIADLEMTVSMLSRVVYLLLQDDMPTWKRERLEATIQADAEAFDRSRAKVMWRSSDSGKAAVFELTTNFDALVDSEASDAKLIEHLPEPMDITLDDEG